MTEKTTEEWLRESVRKQREENKTLRKKIEEIKKENSGLKRRIRSTIHYIERASALGHLNGCEEIMDVVVGTLDGDIH